MNRIALGTVQFGLPYGIANRVGQVTRQEAKEMLYVAATYGVDTLDTAIDYGESESCLGEIDTQAFQIVTKLPAIPVDCVDVSSWVKAQVDASLARLGVSGVYGLLLHRSEQLRGTHGPALYRALQDLKDSGQVQKVGVSIYSPSDLDSLVSQYRLDLVQAPFNLVDRRLATTGWLQRLKDNSVEVHTRSVFLQGLLLMSNADMPAKFARWSELWQRWHLWLAQMGASSVPTCLAFPLSFPEIDRIVVGADSVSQLSQILGAKNSQPLHEFPDLQCDDETLINPAKWPLL